LFTFAALSALPDADVLAVALGAHDGGAIGHRGASHSLCVAVAVGVSCALVARRLGWPVLRTVIAGTLAVASHGILDAFGEGGRGIPLLWPFSDERFMSPWRLLPDAPRGLRLLSSRSGLFDLAIEFLFFLPLTVAAFWPARQPRPRLVAIEGGADAPRTASRAPEAVAVEASEPPVRSTG
jgi:inner membrane protein